jgi:hypothetical protein
MVADRRRITRTNRRPVYRSQNLFSPPPNVKPAISLHQALQLCPQTGRCKTQPTRVTLALGARLEHAGKHAHPARTPSRQAASNAGSLSGWASVADARVRCLAGNSLGFRCRGLFSPS